MGSMEPVKRTDEEIEALVAHAVGGDGEVEGARRRGRSTEGEDATTHEGDHARVVVADEGDLVGLIVVLDSARVREGLARAAIDGLNGAGSPVGARRVLEDGHLGVEDKALALAADRVGARLVEELVSEVAAHATVRVERVVLLEAWELTGN